MNENELAIELLKTYFEVKTDINLTLEDFLDLYKKCSKASHSI